MGQPGYRARSEFYKIAERFDPISPIDLFPFVIGAAIIADADFINPPTLRAGNLRADFDLKAKIIRGQHELIQNFLPEHLVAHFDIRQCLIIHHAEYQGYDPITHVMMEIKRAVRSAIKPRTINDIGDLPIDDQRQHQRPVVRVVFQVRVLNDNDIARSLFEAGSYRTAFTAIALVESDRKFETGVI